MRPSTSATPRMPRPPGGHHRRRDDDPYDEFEGGGSVSRRLVDRRRSVIAARHRRRRTILLGGIALSAAASGAWWMATGPLMTVTHVAVTGYDRPDQAKVVRAVQIASAGADALHVPTAAIERALAGAPWVAGVEVRRDLPRGLSVHIIRATPGAVAVTDAGERYIVSSGGRILAADAPDSVEANSLPEIRVKSGRVGQWLPSGAGRAALSVVAAMSPDVATRVRDLRLSEGVLVGRLSDGVEVRLGQPTDLRRKALALEAVLSNPLAQTDLGNATYLDLSAPTRPIMGGVSRSTKDSTTSADSGSGVPNTQP